MANNVSNVKSHQPRMFSALPPFRHHGAFKPIDAETALEHVQAYLETAQSNPHLHPDAIFSERQGPTYAGIASEGGLVLHQLRRVEAGLRGEFLAAESGIEQFLNPASNTIFDDFVQSEGEVLNAKENQEDYGEDDALDASIAVTQQRRMRGRREAGELPFDDTGDVRDFADMSYNEQMLGQGEEGIVEGEVGIRNNVISQEVPRPKTGEKRKPDGDVGIDKEARKRAKKERQKTEQKQKERVKHIRVNEEHAVPEKGVNVNEVDGRAVPPWRDAPLGTDGESTGIIKKKRKKDRVDQSLSVAVTQLGQTESLEALPLSPKKSSRSKPTESPKTNEAADEPALHNTTNGGTETSEERRVRKREGKPKSKGGEVPAQDSQDEVRLSPETRGLERSTIEYTTQRSSAERQTDMKRKRKEEKQAQKMKKSSTQTLEKLDGSPEL